MYPLKVRHTSSTSWVRQLLWFARARSPSPVFSLFGWLCIIKRTRIFQTFYFSIIRIDFSDRVVHLRLPSLCRVDRKLSPPKRWDFPLDNKDVWNCFLPVPKVQVLFRNSKLNLIWESTLPGNIAKQKLSSRFLQGSFKSCLLPPPTGWTTRQRWKNVPHLSESSGQTEIETTLNTKVSTEPWKICIAFWKLQEIKNIWTSREPCFIVTKMYSFTLRDMCRDKSILSQWHLGFRGKCLVLTKNKEPNKKHGGSDCKKKNLSFEYTCVWHIKFLNMRGELSRSEMKCSQTHRTVFSPLSSII